MRAVRATPHAAFSRVVMMVVARRYMAVIGLVAIASHPTAAMTVDEYLRYRRQVGFDPRLKYEQVEANPAAFAGKVIELAGSVSGSIQRADSVSFLITLDESAKTLMLAAPAADSRMIVAGVSARLRVLARVVEKSQTNAVALDALALAYDNEVTAREQQAAARAAALAKQREEQLRRLRERPAPLSVQSRGYTARSTSSYVPTGPISKLAATYLAPEAQRIYPAYAAFVSKWNRRLTATQVDEITTALLYFAHKHRVDPRLIVALIIAESDFRPYTTSHKGAMGLGQVMPYEAKAYGLSNPYDPIQNIRASVNMLRQRLDKYQEPGTPSGLMTLRQIELAFAAYNAGSGAVRKYGGVPPYRETQAYVRRVISTYLRLCQ